MEFLKGCSTSVQLIRGFDHVRVQRYCMFKRDSHASDVQEHASVRTRVVDQPALLDEASLPLRRANGLAAVDLAKCELWHFQPYSTTDFRAPSTDRSEDFDVQKLFQNSEFELTCTQDSTLKAADILQSGRPQTLNANQRVPRGDSNSENGARSNMQSFKTNSNIPVASNQRSSCDSTSDHQADGNVYGLLISACLQAFQFRAAVDFGNLPITIGKFVERTNPDSGSWNDLEIDRQDRSGTMVMGIHIQLLASGKLLLSIRPEMECFMPQSLVSNSSETVSSRDKLEPIRLAPQGRSAYLLSKISDGAAIRIPPGAKNVCETAFDRRSWRASIRQILIARGIELSLETDSAWASVLVPNIQPVSLDAVSVHSELVIDWPTQLCYSTVAAHDQRRAAVAATGEENDKGGLVRSVSEEIQEDPLDFAVSWKSREEEREIELQNSQSQGVAEEVPHNNAKTIEDPGPQSPSVMRSFSSADQASFTVYPTPPDGAQVQGTPGSQFVEEHDGHPESVQHEYQYQHGGGDFEDADGITDADFSFFDEPDLEIGSDSTKTDQQTALLNGNRDSHPEPDHENPRIEENSREAVNGQSDSPVDVIETSGAAAHARRSEKPEGLGKPRSGSGVFKMPSTPPLSPAVIKNTLEFGPVGVDPGASKHSPARRMSLNKMTFNRTFNLNDQKYSSHGRFASHNGLKREKSFGTGDKPPWDRSKNANSPKYTWARSPNTTTSAFRLSKYIPRLTRGSPGTSDDSSNDDEDDISDAEESAVVWNRTFHGPSKRFKSNEQLSAPTPSVDGNEAEVLEYRDSEHFRLLSNVAISAVLDCTQYACSTASAAAVTRRAGNHSSDHSIRDGKDIIAIAQIVVLQESLSGFNPDWKSQAALISRKTQTLCLESARQASIYDKLAQTFGGEPKPQSLIQFGSVEGTFTTESTIKMEEDFDESPPASQDGDDSDDSYFWIPVPNVRLGKHGSSWTGLPSAVPFWDVLGLGPAGPGRNISSYCIYPSSTHLAGQVPFFLRNLKNAYEASMLGTLNFGLDSESLQSALLPVEGDEEATISSTLLRWKETCTKLAKQLAHSKGESHNILILMVDPFEESGVFYELCACFWSILESIASEGASTSKFALQVIPVDMVASAQTPILSEPLLASRLAREAYDRCGSGMFPDGSVSTPNGPLVELEAPMPKAIEFELCANPPRDLLHECSTIHVSYALSNDGEWLAAAWTDNEGNLQNSAPFFLGGRPTFSEVATEIWDRTIALTEPRKTKWKVFIARCGALPLSERQAWQDISVLSLHSDDTELYLTSVITSPTVLAFPNLPPPREQDTSESSAAQANPISYAGGPYTTPVSTPQGIGNSPAQTPSSTMAGANANAATPSSSHLQADPVDADEGSVLIDVTDESWAMILAHRRNASESPFQYDPALASGYLIKRTGSDELDPPVLMEVNLLSCPEDKASSESREHTQASYDSMLRELLKVYRGLGLLARLKGVAAISSVAPWHVVVAMRAAAALERFMVV